jgi:hypothetical protein
MRVGMREQKVVSATARILAEMAQSDILLAVAICVVVLGAATWIWGAPATRFFRETYWPGRPSPLSWHRLTGGGLLAFGAYLVIAWAFLRR